MEQNVKACLESISRIKKTLDEIGIDNIKVDNGLLVKISQSSFNKNRLVKLTSAISIKCSCLGTTMDISKECPYKSTCNVPTVECPLYKCRCSSTSGSGSSSASGINSGYDCLFRIKPSDIQNGINLYAIILHGESCELKLLFHPSKQGEQDLIDTMNFLV